VVSKLQLSEKLMAHPRPAGTGAAKARCHARRPERQAGGRRRALWFGMAVAQRSDASPVRNHPLPTSLMMTPNFLSAAQMVFERMQGV
jgi:hypothetical protein